jgi:hypothetical protein
LYPIRTLQEAEQLLPMKKVHDRWSRVEKDAVWTGQYGGGTASAVE